MPLPWRDEKRQRSWLAVGVLFALFYFGEAYLFWYPNPRFSPPSFTPLVYWGLFGCAVTYAVTRRARGVPSATKLDRLQSIVLGVAMTAATVGITFIVIRRTNDIILGHIVLLFVLALTGLLIGAMSFNLGWTLAALCWAGAGAWILHDPRYQDYTLGAAVALGFILIGLFTRRIDIQRSSGSGPPSDVHIRG